jgi:hypothetical protein
LFQCINHLMMMRNETLALTLFENSVLPALWTYSRLLKDVRLCVSVIAKRA